MKRKPHSDKKAKKVTRRRRNSKKGQFLSKGEYECLVQGRDYSKGALGVPAN